MPKKKEEKEKPKLRREVGVPTEASGKEIVKKAPKKAAIARVAKSKKEEAAKEKAKTEKIQAVIPEVKLEEKPKQLTLGPRKYFYAVGRRKEATATVKLLTRGSGLVTINQKPLEQYFPYVEWQEKVKSPLLAVGQLKNLDAQAKVRGGGTNGQAEAVRHAISRALLKLNPVFRKSLRRSGFLTRDPRMKERKKYGLKRARRAPQWSKR